MPALFIEPRHEPRLAQFAREGVRYTAQAFQQMRPARRRVVLLATLREMEATLVDGQLIGGIGISGGSYTQDQDAAEAALKAVGFAFPG